MKFKYLSLAVVVMCILFAGNVSADHGNTEWNNDSCSLCHDTPMSNDESDSGNTGSAISDLTEIADMGKVKESAVDIWNDFEEKHGIGSLILGTLLLALIVIAVIMAGWGTIQRMWGTNSGDSNDTKSGNDTIKNVLSALIMFVGTLFVIVLIVESL